METTLTIRPTVIARPGEAREGTLDVLAMPYEGGEKALVVFRDADDARAYQDHAGKHTLAEGYKLVAVNVEELTAILEVHELRYVAMPEPWTGEGVVDTFEADSFVVLLKGEAPEAKRGEA